MAFSVLSIRTLLFSTSWHVFIVFAADFSLILSFIALSLRDYLSKICTLFAFTIEELIAVTDISMYKQPEYKTLTYVLLNPKIWKSSDGEWKPAGVRLRAYNNPATKYFNRWFVLLVRAIHKFQVLSISLNSKAWQHDGWFDGNPTKKIFLGLAFH